jgi:hypothetical protein
MAKGSNFEREVAKQLSLWWTGGSRDDIFWRSCISGGRATQRKKFGKATYGSYGDIAAVDPIGEPLLRMWTIELKRGQGHGQVMALIERKSKVQRPFEKALCQAYRSSRDAKSRGWMLICRRDYCDPMVYIELETLVKKPQSWVPVCSRLFRSPSVRFSLLVTDGDGGRQRMRFVALRLQDFLRRVQPEQVVRAVR